MTGPCPMCGGATWEGPRYMRYGNPIPPDWPTNFVSKQPFDGALMYACGTCGYRRFECTVKDGGDPVPMPQPGQKRPETAE